MVNTDVPLSGSLRVVEYVIVYSVVACSVGVCGERRMKEESGVRASSLLDVLAIAVVIVE